MMKTLVYCPSLEIGDFVHILPPRIRTRKNRSSNKHLKILCLPSDTRRALYGVEGEADGLNTVGSDYLSEAAARQSLHWHSGAAEYMLLETQEPYGTPERSESMSKAMAADKLPGSESPGSSRSSRLVDRTDVVADTSEHKQRIAALDKRSSQVVALDQLCCLERSVREYLLAVQVSSPGIDVAEVGRSRSEQFDTSGLVASGHTDTDVDTVAVAAAAGFAEKA